jgi:hypothetical protein
MSGSAIAPTGGGLVGPLRTIPPLPAGIPILPGQVKAAAGSRRSRKPIVLLAIAAIAILIWGLRWYSAIDGKRIDAVVTPAMYAHVKFGTRLPVTLMSGPRILSIGSSFIEPGVSPPTTCVSVYVWDPKTGAQDPRYFGGQHFDCIAGFSYVIPYPIAH